jgi:predicted NUDIX family phosphoesterase
MSSAVHTERVLVVPTQLFHSVGHFQGLTTDVDRYLDVLLGPGNTCYKPRGEMEQDPSWKQLIPYVLFEFEGPSGIELFRYTRGKGQGEQRLHAKKSVGIGGHISSIDETAGSAYEQGMRRELEEEVFIDTACDERCAGLINDDETDVGRVHLGIVHVFRVQAPAVRARETDISDAGFAPLSAILGELDRYETWSQICLKALYQD